MNDRIIELALGDHGLISFRAKPGHKYKWMLHETPTWFEKAKMVQGKDWFLFNDKCLRIAPPLIITETEIEKACKIILESLSKL